MLEQMIYDGLRCLDVTLEQMIYDGLRCLDVMLEQTEVSPPRGGGGGR